MQINEMFESIQGEGPYCGTPSFFIRLSGCNKACSFCDTRHQTHDDVPVSMLAENIIQMGYMNIVITGGEPTLQYNEVFQLVTAIKSHYIKTKGRPVATISCPECQVEERLPTFYIETNGSIATIDMVLSSPVDHWIISPKDPVSADYWVRTLKNAPGPVHGKVMLKFVVKTPKDLPEELGDMVFFVQPMILPGQDPLQEYAGLVKDVLANMKTFPNIVILPQLHKLIGVK